MLVGPRKGPPPHACHSLLGVKILVQRQKGIEIPDKSMGIPEKKGIFSPKFSPKDSMLWLASAEKTISPKHSGLKIIINHFIIAHSVCGSEFWERLG